MREFYVLWLSDPASEALHRYNVEDARLDRAVADAAEQAGVAACPVGGGSAVGGDAETEWRVEAEGEAAVAEFVDLVKALYLGRRARLYVFTAEQRLKPAEYLAGMFEGEFAAEIGRLRTLTGDLMPVALRVTQTGPGALAGVAEASVEVESPEAQCRVLVELRLPRPAMPPRVRVVCTRLPWRPEAPLTTVLVEGYSGEEIWVAVRQEVAGRLGL